VIRIGVVGPRTTDIIERPGEAPQLRPGGSPHYAGRALVFAGAEPVVLETPGLVVSRFAAGGGHALHRLAEPATPAWIGSHVGALQTCAWLALGGQSASDFPPETLALLAAERLPVLLDCQGLARGRNTGPVRLRPFSAEAVAGAMAVKLNEAEARALTGNRDPSAVRLLGVPEVLVSRGEHGAVLVTPSAVDAVASNGVLFTDSIGAGDSLSALYCLGRANGGEPVEALQYAVSTVEELFSQ
jgi:sugar/nucleoside kinase (ribokinase family)